jgi:hypothetical protein
MTARIISDRVGDEALRFDGIIIGKDFYLNMDGIWSKPTTEIPDIAALSNPQRVNEMWKQNGPNEPKFKLVGPDTINGNSVVEFEDPAMNVDGHPGAFRVWIGTIDNLVHRVEAEAEAKPGDPSSKVKVTITYRDYNANIKIEPPM